MNLSFQYGTLRKAQKYTIQTFNKKISLPLYNTGNYNFVVDWGDGNTSLIDHTSTPLWRHNKHTYQNPGVYNVTITGTLEGFSLGDGFTTGENSKKLIRITNWGILKLSTGSLSDDSFFKDAANLVEIRGDSEFRRSNKLLLNVLWCF